jgi:P-type E1-E2 ATPase
MLAVIMISMIKEGIEDIKRHRTDAKLNSRPARIVNSDGSISVVQRQNLVVGSIVMLHRDEEIPADIVVLVCGGIQGGISYVETAAIDGETNLKIKNVQKDINPLF